MPANSELWRGKVLLFPSEEAWIDRAIVDQDRKEALDVMAARILNELAWERWVAERMAERMAEREVEPWSP